MKHEKCRLDLYLTAGFLLAFILWTVALCFIDRKPVGPQDSVVGFASLNTLVHNALGVHMGLYVLTDWLGLVPIVFCVYFAVLGLCQWIGRKKLLKVDYDILALGVFYLLVGVAFALFEMITLNYRPILIDGVLEGSYPSSTTLLVTCVVATTIMQAQNRVKNPALRTFVTTVLWIFMLFMVIARLISGVHWFTDIIGGLLLSGTLIFSYRCLLNRKQDYFNAHTGTTKCIQRIHGYAQSFFGLPLFFWKNVSNG